MAQGTKLRPVVEAGPLCVDLLRQRATLDGVELALRGKQVGLLAMLAWKAGEPVSRAELYAIAFDRPHSETRRLDVLVSRVRATLVGARSAVRIETVRGVGYRLA